jgi:hypothetical protein
MKKYGSKERLDDYEFYKNVDFSVNDIEDYMKYFGFGSAYRRPNINSLYYINYLKNNLHHIRDYILQTYIDNLDLLKRRANQISKNLVEYKEDINIIVTEIISELNNRKKMRDLIKNYLTKNKQTHENIFVYHIGGFNLASMFYKNNKKIDFDTFYSLFTKLCESNYSYHVHCEPLIQTLWELPYPKELILYIIYIDSLNHDKKCESVDLLCKMVVDMNQ